MFNYSAETGPQMGLIQEWLLPNSMPYLTAQALSG